MAFKLSEALSMEEAPEKSYLSSIFAEEPVSLEVFIKDKKFLGSDWMLSPLQAELVQVSERVYLPSLYPLMAEEFGGYWADTSIIPMRNLIAAQWGKGGGKDHTVRMVSLRIAYLLLCLKSPQEYFGMPETDSIHMLNIAANSGQANRAFFKPMTEAVKRGWFKDHADPKRDTITYAKNLEAVSGHSDAEGQEGLNLILGVADEIDAFKAQNEMVGNGKREREASTSAESILKMLKGSASTRFPASYKRLAISYPRYLGSTIQQLTFEAQEDVKEMGDQSIYFASGPYATWEVNPLRKGKEEFASDYRTNPEEAAAMYECKPVRATNPYFRNPEIFSQSVTSETQPLTVDYKTVTLTSKVTGRSVVGWEPVFNFHPDFKPIQGARYAMHGDLAIRGDRAGIAMSHVKRWEERTEITVAEDGEHIPANTTVPIIAVDFVIAFEADIGETPSREIQIRWARVLAFELIKRGFTLASFTFDGFQSADTIQILTGHGIESDRVSTDKDPDIWKTVKDVASDNRLEMPFSQLLINELTALSRIENKVDHPPNGSKDLADAFACSIVGAIAVGGEEDPDGLVAEIGVSFFEVGEALAPLEGAHEMESFGGGLALPMGMKGMGY